MCAIPVFLSLLSISDKLHCLSGYCMQHFQRHQLPTDLSGPQGSGNMAHHVSVVLSSTTLKYKEREESRR